MTTYISMLRGINVTGSKKVLMAELKLLYEGIGLKDVSTYIQSGNVLFRTTRKENIETLQTRISEVIKQHYEYDVPVIIRTVEEMEQVIENNPYIKAYENDKLYVTFLTEAPSKDYIKQLNSIEQGADKFELIDREIFLYVPEGYGKTKLSNTFFEKKLKQQATTRNLNTVKKLAALGKALS
jgi:uncharacterized protein (DUF1697 family)